jgi:hypothetical protein
MASDIASTLEVMRSQGPQTARRQPHGFGGLAQQFGALRVGCATVSSTDDDNRDKMILMSAFRRLQDRLNDIERLGGNRGEAKWYSLF